MASRAPSASAGVDEPAHRAYEAAELMSTMMGAYNLRLQHIADHADVPLDVLRARWGTIDNLLLDLCATHLTSPPVPTDATPTAIVDWLAALADRLQTLGLARFCREAGMAIGEPLGHTLTVIAGSVGRDHPLAVATSAWILMVGWAAAQEDSRRNMDETPNRRVRMLEGTRVSGHDPYCRNSQTQLRAALTQLLS